MLNRRAFLRGAAGAAAIGGAGLGLLGAVVRPAWGALAKRLSGRLLLPNDGGYAAFALPNNLRYATTRPGAIALCKSAQDVSASIQWARENNVPLVARSGGHSYAGYSTTNGLMIDMRQMNGVSFDEHTGVATLGGGARNANLIKHFMDTNIAITHGRCPSVGIAGLTLGGGIGFNMRAHGLTCDQLVATEIVTADGTIHRVSGDDDLFWACRGAGGGNFGINTSFEYQAYDVEPMTVCNLTWATHTERVFAALVNTLERAPTTLGSKLSVISPTTTTGIQIQLLVQYSGTPAQLREMLADAYAIAQPSGTIVQEAYWKSQTVLSEPGTPAYYQERSRFFNGPVSDGAIAVIFEWIRKSPKSSPEAGFKIFQTGGRVNDKKSRDMAFVHRQSTWLSSIELYWEEDTPATTLAQYHAWQTGFYDAIVPFANGGGAYQNFIDPSLRDWKSAYHGINLERLEAIKQRVDPTGVFTFAEAIPRG
jgi:FAD/FMN-containing dehydrogenase